MAVIPRYQEQLRVRGADPSLVSVPQLRDPLGGALQRLGGQLERAAQTYDETRFRRDAAFAEAATGNAARWAQQALEALDTSPDDKFDEAERKARTELDSIRLKTLGGMKDDRVRAKFQVDYDDLRGRVEERVRAIRAKRTAAVTAQSLSTGIAGRAVEVAGDPDTFLVHLAGAEQAIDDATITTEARIAMRREARSQLATAAVEAFIRLDPDAAAQALGDGETKVAAIQLLDPKQRATALTIATKAASDRRVDTAVSSVLRVAETNMLMLPKIEAAVTARPDLSDDERAAISSQVRTRLGLLRDRRVRENLPALTSLQMQVRSGTVGSDAEGRALALYRRGALDESGYAGIVSAIGEARAQAARRSSGVNDALARIAAGTPLDPKSDADRDAVDALFAAAIGKPGDLQAPAIEPGSPAWREAAVNLTKRASVVPPSAVGWARAALASENPVQAAQAADLLDRLETAAPFAFGFGVDDRTRAKVEAIVSATRAGATPELAVAAARRLEQQTPTETRLIDERYRAVKAAQLNPGELKSRLDGDPRFAVNGIPLFRSAPEPPSAMQADFETGVRRYFAVNGGDVQRAREAAWRDVTRKWAVSKVASGTPELIEYAPDLLYPELTRETIVADVAARPTPVPAERIRLVPTDATARTNGMQWSLGYVDEDGLLQIVMREDGRPRQYILPIERARQEAAEKRKAAAASAVAKARAQTERQRATIELLREQMTAGDEDAARLLPLLDVPAPGIR